MKKVLVYQKGGSDKFWEIETFENHFTITYGRIGTNGSIKTKTFESEIECFKEAKKLIQSKIKKGYMEVPGAEGFIKEQEMSKEVFWELIRKAGKKEDVEESLEWLTWQLSRKTVKEILAFDAHFHDVYYESYTSDLWCAAYIIMGGCSDDLFDYFRAWLIFQGQETYERVIGNPEALLEVLAPYREEEDWYPELEDLLSVTSDAYEEKTGFDFEVYHDLFYATTKGIYIQPDIEFDWDDDEESMKGKFPKLWEEYGENPMF